MQEPEYQRFEPLPAPFDSPGLAWPDAAVPRELHDALLERTTALVRSRARRKRLGRLAAVAVAYAAGLATTWAARPAQFLPAGPRPGTVETPLVVKQPTSPAEETLTDLASLPPAELRRLVPDAPQEEQVRLLQLAGDRYLYSSADVASALDCYRQVLELTPREKLGRPGPQDSWLLAELKLSALE